MSVMRFLAGFAVGAALGAVAGILLAPKSGEETRELLGEMASDLAKKNRCYSKRYPKKSRWYCFWCSRKKWRDHEQTTRHAR